MTDNITVTQADREAAAILPARLGMIDLTGPRNQEELAEAFARHRISQQEAKAVEGDVVAWLYEKKYHASEGFVQIVSQVDPRTETHAVGAEIRNVQPLTKSQDKTAELLREALQALSDASDEVNGAIDAQTYDEKRKMENWPDDYEFCVNITAKQESDLNTAIVRAQKMLSDHLSQGESA